MGKHRFPNQHWITSDGSIDIARLPLESNFTAALNPDRQRARDSMGVLKLAAHHGRVEASVFLMGLLVSLPPDDWEMRAEAVDALRYTCTERCAALLFSELRRVKSSNTTRAYINSILDVLHTFPEALVREEFEALADDTSFSHKMRQKFRFLAYSGHPKHSW